MKVTMPILSINNKEEVKRLTNFFEKSEYATFYQTFEYAILKSDKWKSEYVYVEENGKIVAGMLVLIRKIGKIFTIMYTPRGPVVDLYNIRLLQKLVDEARPLAKKYKAFVLKMAPEIEYDAKLENDLKTIKLKVRSKFKNILQPMQTQKNMILDIEGKTSEELMAEYSPKTRYNIKLAKKKGVTVRYSNLEKDLIKFYDLMDITAKRDKIALREYEYFKKLMEIYKENIRIYLAEYENEALAAALTVNYGGKVIYFYGASSNKKRNLMPCYILQQTMIEWGLETNCKIYDFGGVFNTTKDNGLYRFKEGFCRKKGVTTFIGEIDKIYNPFLYYIFENILPKVKKIMLKIDARRKKDSNK